MHLHAVLCCAVLACAVACCASAGVCSQIMGIAPSHYKSFLQPTDKQQSPPPVLFVHMTKDSHTAQVVELDVQLRKELVSQLPESWSSLCIGPCIGPSVGGKSL